MGGASGVGVGPSPEDSWLVSKCEQNNPGQSKKLLVYGVLQLLKLEPEGAITMSSIFQHDTINMESRLASVDYPAGILGQLSGFQCLRFLTYLEDMFDS